MNRAQKNILKLMDASTTHEEKAFLSECFSAWEGYDDMQYSYPAWQLRALEKKHGMTAADIKSKYKITL